MITFLSAALKGGKTSTWRMVSILSGDTPLFFCNGRFSFCFLPFFESFVSANVQNVLFDICERFVAKFLLHLSPLSAFFILLFCLFSKVLFLQMFKTCLFNIFMRFIAKFFVALVHIVGGFALCNKIKQHLPIYFKTKRL